jgi:hypothetical protein
MRLLLTEIINIDLPQRSKQYSGLLAIQYENAYSHYHSCMTPALILTIWTLILPVVDEAILFSNEEIVSTNVPMDKTQHRLQAATW